MIKYNAPELEIITFQAEDIITASYGENHEPDWNKVIDLPADKVTTEIIDGELITWNQFEDANGNGVFDQGETIIGSRG